MNRRILCLTLFLLAALALTAPAALAEGEAEPQSPPPAAEPEPTPSPEPEPTPTPEPVPDGWQKEDGMWYYYSGGEKLTGWQTIDGERYYFRPNGCRAAGWTRVKGKTYYFGPDGLAYSGPHYIHETGKMYMFSPSGMLRKGPSVWVYGQEYATEPSGALVGYLSSSSGMAAAVLDEIGWNLRSAFNWAASLPYYDRENRAPEDAVHSDWYATYGFTYRCGNCYVMAATFYQMAKLLGYNVYYIEGGVGSYKGTVIDHGWTEIIIDGQTYVFDPDFTNEEGVDGFQIWYEKPGTWWYYQPVRVP